MLAVLCALLALAVGDVRGQVSQCSSEAYSLLQKRSSPDRQTPQVTKRRKREDRASSSLEFANRPDERGRVDATRDVRTSYAVEEGHAAELASHVVDKGHAELADSAENVDTGKRARAEHAPDDGRGHDHTDAELAHGNGSYTHDARADDGFGHQDARSAVSIAVAMLLLCVVAYFALNDGCCWVFFDKYFIIIGITVALLVGLTLPGPGRNLERAHVDVLGFSLPQMAVVIIFTLSGLNLDSPSEVNKPRPLLLGVVFILLLTPLLAFPIKVFGAGLLQTELLRGLALFCVVPTTLSSGVAMVKQANGNAPLALALTTLTNCAGCFTLPYTSSWIFSAEVKIPAPPMLKQLVLQTFVPFVFGLALAEAIPAVKKLAGESKRAMSRACSCCIFFVVWLTSSSAQSRITSLPAKDLIVCAWLAGLVHLVYRGCAYVIATAASLEEKEWVAFVLMGSQKSLPVCVSVLSTLPAQLQVSVGVSTIPCIMAHFSQLLIDAVLTVRWTMPET